MNLTTQAERKLCRREAGLELGNNAPVVLIPGNIAPRYCGETAHYTNKSGSRIYHPSSYSKKGYSSMIYHYSTRRVEVGVRWLDKRRIWK